jgi:hypothetical protein
MRQTSRSWRILIAAVALLFAAAAAQADTIVLKNGRRIVALNVREEGDKVKYETAAGELSLPKSIVDHIEKGGVVPMGDSPAAAAANLAITPPAMEATSGGTEIESGAVHDGAIDRDYIAKLEGAAKGGGQLAIMRRHSSSFRVATWNTRWPTNVRRSRMLRKSQRC